MSDTPFARQLLDVNIEDEMRSSYLDYSMSVIVGRALPNARDGLKPVHRRILYAMFREGLLSNRRYSKCAGVVGEVLKKYHPHGDAAVYDALVRMAQPWNLRYPLVDGQGNFGSVDGDPPAAYRYTESRMTRVAEELLADIDKDTVDFEPNFDGSTVEPRVMPTRLPNLLVNGSSGIAVGMATNIPPHNVREVIDAAIALIDDPELTIRDLMRHVPGPDFPTAGVIYGRAGVIEAYETGRGRVIVRGRAEIEKMAKGDREQIVITEIPYQVNKARLIEHIAELVKDKKIEGISDLRDESDRRGMRIVVELKRDAIGHIVLNHLFKHTALQSTFGVNMLAIVDGRPEILDLKQALQQFLIHRKEVTVRRSRFELRQAEARAHILLGFIKALDHLDEVIAIIRHAPGPAEAKSRLMERFDLSDAQSQAILDLRLQRLTGMEQAKIRDEYAEVQATITRLKELLASEARIFALIKEELVEVRERYADERRTQFMEDTADLSIEDLIPDEDMVVTVSHLGYVKRSAVREYRAQRRGGKGRTGMQTREEDFVEDLFVASSHEHLLIFTEKGQVYRIRVHEIPAAGPAARGRPLVNLVPIAPDDKPAAVVPVRSFDDSHSVVAITRKGMIKRTNLSAFSRVLSSGIIGMKLREDDGLLVARLLANDSGRSLLVATREGKAIRFQATDEQVREMGRDTQGVRAVTLVGDDEVVALVVLDDEEGYLLSVTANGYGKRTPIPEYRLQNRGGIGLIDIKTRGRNGSVIGAVQVTDEHQIMLVTDGGIIIRMRARDIGVVQRNTMGVRLISLCEDEHVVGLARIVEPPDDEDDEVGPSGDDGLVKPAATEPEEDEEGAGAETDPEDDDVPSEDDGGIDGEED
ncbi:DNA gyrase subunit A [Myxococcota bacterium]|nr:DNA gyrase subunit A [Myxococcota bacterium]